MNVESKQQIPQKTCNGRTVKLSAKVQEVKAYISDQNYLHSVQNTDVECLIIELLLLLDNWKEDTKMLLITQSENLYLSKQNDSFIYIKDPTVVLATKIYAANANDLD